MRLSDSRTGWLRLLRGTTEARSSLALGDVARRCSARWPSRPASRASIPANWTAFRNRRTRRSDRGRPGVAVPRVARPAEPQADTTPLFVLRNVSLTGAHAIPPARLATAWQPYHRQKGLAGRPRRDRHRASATVYRAAGFHLSRAIVPPQDIAGRRGPRPGHRRRHHRGGAERRGRRAVRHPRACWRRCSPNSRRGWRRWSGS